jgi:DNA-binding LacI/PurR family transcriptional regulator
MAAKRELSRSVRRAGEVIPTAPATRTQEAYTRLTQLAHDLGPEAQLPTFNELREWLGVSVVTLSRALDLLAAHKILYRRHGVGIFVSADLGRKSIALICSPTYFEGPEISPFWQILVEQLRRHVTERQNDLTLHFSAYPGGDAPFFEDFVRSVEDRRVHGVLAIGLDADAVEWLVDHGVPMVGFAGTYPYQVDVDFAGLVWAAVGELAARGRRRLGLWINHVARYLPAGYWLREENRRESGHVSVFKEALAAHGIAFEPSLVRDSRFLSTGPEGEPPQTFWEQGYQTALAVFGEGSNPALRPDGIVSVSELFSQGALIGMQRVGVRIGVDVQVASHANRESPILRPWRDEITLLEVDAPVLARTMLATLEAVMVGEPPATSVLWHAATPRRPQARSM